ncbi:hypothetical protein HK099_008516, partial [Clydaea vesicula]
MGDFNSGAQLKEALDKQRERIFQETQRKKVEIQQKNKVVIGKEKFVAQSDFLESELKTKTYGLVALRDFQRIKDEVLKNESKKGVDKKRKKLKEKVKISFDNEDEEAGVEETADNTAFKKLKKNPTVDTSFLPDKEREEQEKKLKELELVKWLEEQEIIKAETISIPYTYWNGTGKNREMKCLKGDTIGKFLENCKNKFPEIKGINPENLMFIKSDIIIPHSYTFYEFYLKKTRGKNGPLFDFEDVKNQKIKDLSVAKED